MSPFSLMQETMRLCKSNANILCAFALLSFGHMHVAQAQPAVAPAVASVSEPALASPATLSERQVPRVTLRWDCGDCEPNEKVFPLIEKTYADKAAAKGYAVSGTETAEIVVTKYRQRPPATRVLFGFMAGKDILETRVTFRGTDFSAGDYSANVMQGMNFLCETVAQQTLDKLLVSLQTPAKPAASQ